MKQAQTSSLLNTVAWIGIVFGLLTIVSGGQVLFGSQAQQASAGAYVASVLWFNFLAGFAYVAAGIGILLRHRWSVWLSVAIAVATLFVFAAFGLHVLTGGAYEMRTMGAMVLRLVVWAAIAWVAWRRLPGTLRVM